MYPAQNESGQYEDLYQYQNAAGEFDQDFWLDFLHKQEIHGAHEAETPYGYATPYFYDYETASLHDHPFRQETQEYDPYGYLHHEHAPYHGHDEYLGVEDAHHHSVGL